MRLNLGEIAVSLGCAPEMRTGENSYNPPANERSRRQAGSWAGIFPNGAQVDSRHVVPGNLFFCFAGEKADGHDFAFAAAKAGACAIIAGRNPFLSLRQDLIAESLPLPPVFLVKDVKKALWRIATGHRDTALARVIGVTGTAGKTSVKEVLAQVLEVRGSADRNFMNQNNQIGLPLSMLNASSDASFWVMELGISEAHDMDELGKILRPDIGVILNVGDGHVLGLGEQGVAAHKARLLEYMHLGGVALVSSDYPDLNEQVEKRLPLLEQRDVTCLRFSTSDANAFCHARYVGPDQDETGLYSVRIHHKDFVFKAPFRGDFGSENVAAIVAVATSLGFTEKELETGLSKAKLPEQRFKFRREGKFSIVDDSYNANPLSSRRMICAAGRMARESGLPLVLVMGEMLELGDKATSAHEELGRYMAQEKPARIFWKGGHGATVQRGLNKTGFSGEFYPIEGGQDFSLLLEELRLESALVLFKGSRSNHLENLVDIFRESIAPRGGAGAV